MQQLPPVAQALDDLHIPYRVYTHSAPVHSLEQAAAERGQQPDQVVRSLLFRLKGGRLKGEHLGEGEYAMILMAGPDQVSWKALRKHVGQSRLTTASEEEVLSVTGYAIGAVGPLGLRQPVQIFIDQNLLAQEEVSVGSGIRGTAVILTTADLRRALPDAEVGNLRAE